MNPTMRTMRLAGLFAVALSQAAFPYETPVHQRMTEMAFTRAVRERDFLINLGVIHKFDANGNLLTVAFEGASAVGWASLGSVYEDSLTRPRFHFFDPLAPPGAQGLHGFQAAPDWALNAIDNATYSVPGTRNSLYGALTNTDTIVRPKMWRDTFRGVGQFTHLLQDMAQPQHVRNDGHFSLSEQLYFLFPDYSRYESRTLTLLRLDALTFGNYPTVARDSYRGFWADADGKGLAQSTTLNFASEGTLDGSRASPPLANLLDEVVIAQVLDVRGNPINGATNVTVQYVAYTYTDPYTGQSVNNNRLAAFSFFDFQREAMTGRRVYSLNNTVHEKYAGILIPQAVGYSTGLIKRFFRGALEISRPDEQVYGVVDHATTHQTDALNGFVGFDKIKVKVKNATANNEAINGGRIVAVAKFHRNGCYKEDLSGEFTAGGPACNDYPTPTEEIVVSSNEFTGITLDSTPRPFTFTFAPRQIPLNAMDLMIQVVYRGPLGNDADEIAVGTVDVFEPTYLAVFNSTDQLLYNGTWTDTTSPSLLPALDKNNDGRLDVQYDRANMDIYFGFTDGFGGANPMGFASQLPPASYFRVVMLTDRSPYPAPIQTLGPAFNTASIYLFTPETNQFNVDTGGYRVAQFSNLRGIPSWDSLTLYRSEPFQNGDLTLLPPLPDANKAPVPLTTLTFQ